jgi:membrane glycosyltransferase
MSSQTRPEEAAAGKSGKPPFNWKKRVRCRRIILGAIILCQSTIATFAMLQVLPYHGGNVLEACLAMVFSLLFFGISIGFWLGLYGFLLRTSGGDPCSLLRRYPEEVLTQVPPARTAIVMPIYHEPIERTFAGLRTVYQSLADSGHLDHFDVYILSDSRNPEYWLTEQAAWYQLCQELEADGRLFYRRRAINLKHKSGNIADFLRRWGRNYKYFMVLDADSVINAATTIKMVQLMELEPQIGILQSCPVIINGSSLYARSQQFASQLFGPIFSTGLAALQLGEATYWGHNALLRTEPFMRFCGLKKLKGKGLFRGAIMSHDFVEAAYMGRAGYEIWLEPDLPHSYEESPPTLVEDLVRDRRWAKGNLQHLWLLFHEKHLRPAHRLAFVHGIMAYASSPLWLLFLILSGLEAYRLIIWPINYFPEQYSQFPVWPEWHPELALTLISSTFVLLFLPKILAIVDAIINARSSGFGGLLPLITSCILESLISTLLAPIRMLAHSRFVIEALVNVNLQWAGQNRTEETSLRTTLFNQLPGTVLAASWAFFTYRLELNFFIWSLPIVMPLLLATPISILLGRKNSGLALRRFGLFTTIEEQTTPILLENNIPISKKGNGRQRLTAFEEAIIDPTINGLQQAMARTNQARARTETLEPLRQRCLHQGTKALSVHESSILARDRESLRWLHQAVWQVDKTSCWWPLLSSREA